jgi:hypothetical protein
VVVRPASGTVVAKRPVAAVLAVQVGRAQLLEQRLAAGRRRVPVLDVVVELGHGVPTS